MSVRLKVLLQIAKLNKALENSSVQVGDVLRGVTCTNFVYEVRICPVTSTRPCAPHLPFQGYCRFFM